MVVCVVVSNFENMISDLPYDLKEYIYKIVKEERAPKKVLTPDLKRDIESFQLINNIKRNYQQVFPRDYLHWIENGIINILNDNRGFNEPFNECFHTIFPNSTDNEIKQKLKMGNYLMPLWIIMPSHKRFVLYDISCDVLVHYI